MSIMLPPGAPRKHITYEEAMRLFGMEPIKKDEPMEKNSV